MNGTLMELTGSGKSLPPGTQVREYRLQGVLGEGGFGIVYRAHDSGLDRTVAIKEYMPSVLASRGAAQQIQVHPEHREAFDAGLRSFINEARLLAKFSHPALVHVYRFFEENGTAYMVMRHYEGQTFRAFLAEQSSGIDEAWLSAMLGPILDGLEMLHAADCFHRDIAPDNVFLRTTGMPVLLDFGAARRIIGDMTQALTTMLKPGYAPIEQYADDGAAPQGAWTDIYQLGALLYRAITGKVPATSVARMINDPIRMLTPNQYPGYSARFLRGVHQALSVRPEDRPQSIAEFKSLLGLEGFTFSAFSAWSASDAMPLDVLESPLDISIATAPPQLQAPAAPPAPLATADYNLSEVTTVRLADTRINSPDAAAQTSPVFVFKESVDVTEGKGLWQPPTTYGAATSTLTPTPSPTAMAVAHRNKLPWKLAALLMICAGMLAGVWYLAARKPASHKPPVSVVAEQNADQKSWEAANKERTVASLQAYLTAHPAGQHVAEARALLTSLNQAAAPVAPSTASSAAEVVVPSQTAPVVARTSPTTESAVNPPPVAPARAAANPNSSVNSSANTNPPPLVIRPRTPPTPAEEPTVSATENRPPAPVEMGTVALKVTPWGNVRVNRSPVGSTPPLTQLNLPEGQHQIEISNPNGSTVTKLINVTKGETAVLSHKFD
ncbi:MAG: protein kinase domain-containing protein [Burkholderiales bacterium]